MLRLLALSLLATSPANSRNRGKSRQLKTRAITADVVDEIATSAYISQQQRQQEAEQILTTVEQSDEQEAELDSIKAIARTVD